MRWSTTPDRGRSWILCVTMLVALSCSGGSDGPTDPPPPPPPPEVSVTVSPSAATVDALQGTVQLSATVQNSSAAVAWSSLDATIASVSGGLVTALTNGTARIVAAAATKADTALVTVQQAASAVVVTPETGNVVVGGTLLLVSEVRDRNAHVIASGQATWTSINPAIASVSSGGLVTGLSAGTALIEVAAGSARDTASIAVAVAPLIIERDTTLSGSLTGDDVTIAAGVQVQVASDFVVDAQGSVTINGTVTGNCVAIVVNGQALTVTGVVRNTCTDATQDGKDLRLNVTGPITMTGATIESDGEIEIANVPAGAFALRPANARMHGPVAAAEEGVNACDFQSTTIGQPGLAPAGVDGSPNGTNGRDGNRRVIRCDGQLTFVASKIIGEGGGPGGKGTATAGEPGRGGKGGRGGDVWMLGRSGAHFSGSSLVFVYAGGRGGHAEGGPDTRAEAIGGDGGDSGLPLFTFSPTGGITVDPSGLDLVINGTFAQSEAANVKDGGSALARGKNGADATASLPAQQGDSAKARGGKAGSVQKAAAGALRGRIAANGLLPTILFMGAFGESIFEITHPQNPGNIQLQVDPVGVGGSVSVWPGNGGNGNVQFPRGATGGNHRAEGGEGGSTLILDNRAGVNAIGTPGDGGAVTLMGGNGGIGLNGCALKPYVPGGQSGDGGISAGFTGAPGVDGNGVPATRGAVHFQQTGNGQYGADGAGPAPGGNAGAFIFSLFGQKFDDGLSYKKGLEGAGCVLETATDVDVFDDQGNHQNFDQGFKGKGKRHRTRFGPGGQGPPPPPPPPQVVGSPTAAASSSVVYQITIEGESPWQTLTGTVTADDSVHAGTFGQFAGFNNVEFRFEGTVVKDAAGGIIGYDGLLTVGGNGALPGGKPIIYAITAREDPVAPRPVGRRRGPVPEHPSGRPGT